MDGADHVLSALRYEYPVDQMIAMAKFGRRVDAARSLGECLSLYLRSRMSAPGWRHSHGIDGIVPVPLHHSRLADRGFNQALEIASPVAEELGLPLLVSACRRIRNTREQTSLARAARTRNMRNAFRATNEVAGRRIAVIDDVLTTGSTADAVACALRAEGAARVVVWSVARTVRIETRTFS
jgi:ComF family protein